MNREIIRNIEDLLKPINKKLDDLPTKEDFNSLSMGLRQEIAHLESQVYHIAVELNDVQQYIRRYDLRIFNVPVTAIANKEVFGRTLEYFTQKLGVNKDRKDIDRAHRIGKERGGKVQIIVQFFSWELRCLVFRNRKTGNCPIRVDLTKRNVALFNDIQNALLQYSTLAKYAFIDINCKIGVKLQDDKTFFLSL